MNLCVVSVAAADPLPHTQLYRNTVDFLAKEKPLVTVFVAAWSEKLQGNPERLKTAVDEILQHSEFLVLLAQPPILPESASRQFFRENGVVAVYEDSEIAKQRQHFNDFLYSFESSRVKVIETESYFINPGGQLKFVDAKGRQLFQDKTHLSGVGASLLEKPLSETLSTILERKKF